MSFNTKKIEILNMSGIEFGFDEKIECSGINVVPIFAGKKLVSNEYKTLYIHDALKKGWITMKEKEGKGEVAHVLLTVQQVPKEETYVFTPQGYVFEGGGQTRQARKSFYVSLMKEETFEVPVQCVEKERWQADSIKDFRTTSDSMITSPSIRFNLEHFKRNQGEDLQSKNWTRIQNMQTMSGSINETLSFSKSMTSFTQCFDAEDISNDETMADLSFDSAQTMIMNPNDMKTVKHKKSRFKESKEQFEDLRKVIPQHQNQIGIAVARVSPLEPGRREYSVEYAKTSEIWAKMHHQVLDGYCYEYGCIKNPQEQKFETGNLLKIAESIIYKKDFSAESVGVEKRILIDEKGIDGAAITDPKGNGIAHFIARFSTD